MSAPDALQRLLERTRAFAREGAPTRVSGVVTQASHAFCRVEGLSHFLTLGDCVEIDAPRGPELYQTIRVGRDGALVKSFGLGDGVGLNARACRVGPIQIAPDRAWLGRTLDAFCRPIDGKGALATGGVKRAVQAPPPRAMNRTRVERGLLTGVRAIDAFTPLCEGQRVGVFAGSGVGKSTLLAMLTRAEGFGVVVVCLVGERGREARDFLQEAGFRRETPLVSVVATGDESPMMRRLAPLTAMTIAEYFRDRGESVLLVVDSVTRFAHASREAALAAGEPPVAHGYPPSVFADLPRLLERAGPGEAAGSITAIFSVLVDGDNHNDPIADCVRGALDGHIVLERSIAEEGRYPAIDVLKSISRLADRAWTKEQREAARRYRSMLARFEETRDLRMLGGYAAGSDPELDRAIAAAPQIYRALTQSPQEPLSRDVFAEIARALGRSD